MSRCHYMLWKALSEKISDFAENLVLWARLETMGCTVNPAASGSGMMEFWNVGMSKIRLRRTGFSGMGLIIQGWPDQYIKSGRHPLSIPNIPLYHHSIIPFGIYGKLHRFLRAPGSTSRKLGADYLLKLRNRNLTTVVD